MAQKFYVANILVMIKDNMSVFACDKGMVWQLTRLEIGFYMFIWRPCVLTLTPQYCDTQNQIFPDHFSKIQIKKDESELIPRRLVVLSKSVTALCATVLLVVSPWPLVVASPFLRFRRPTSCPLGAAVHNMFITSGNTPKSLTNIGCWF